jgi:hypothetical protein
MPKKKVFVARNLKDRNQVYHSKNENENQSFFIATILCFPEAYQARQSTCLCVCIQVRVHVNVLFYDRHHHHEEDRKLCE